MTTEFVMVGDDFERSGSLEFRVDVVKRIVAQRFNISVATLDSPLRYKSIALARHIAMYLVRTHGSKSYPEIAREFGNRDHTTVMSAVRKVRDLIETDPKVARVVDELEKLARAGRVA